MRIRSCVRINARGNDLYRFINMLHEEGIECRGQYCRNNTFYADVPKRDMKRLQSTAESCGITLKTAEYRSLFLRLRLLRRRIGLLAGAAAAAAAVLYFSRTVVTIDIQGNSSVSDEKILAALSELNIKTGTPVFSIDPHRSENRLCMMMDEIAWAGIRHTGSRLVVQVREAEPVPEIKPERVPCNIIAARDAEITDLKVRRGHLMHTVGEYVPEGTLLISGVAEDQKGRTYIYHAMGEVRGKYTDTVSFSAPFRREEYTPTGRKHTQRTLRLFSLDIPISFGKDHFRSSSAEISEKKLRLFGNELPLGIRKKKLMETAPAEMVFSEEELRQRLMKRIFIYEKNFLSDDTVMLSRNISSRTDDDILTLTVTYELEGVISQQKDLFLK
ncbi:sporulation protein YqfD [Ruminococcus flavefaciens]|uniref:sporulation protein YqfD n=1 Tax=Ruminococcus flavefaciens TaxID=1265 RepID=UPI00036BDD0A|nr:sporulation protein YqfD [Ruminococcus flavefaciens]